MNKNKASNSPSRAKGANHDEVFKHSGGFGLFQGLTLCLLLVASAFAAFPFAEFVFAAKDVRTRCFISECETWRNIDWKPDWLNLTIPTTANGFDQCNRFKPVYELGICYEEFFTNMTEPCQLFVHENRDNIIHDFAIECNEWFRILIGISHGLALLAFQPFAWFLTDRVGRSSVITACTLFSTLMSLIRATSVNYDMYIVLYLLSSASSGGALTASYILATELVGSKWIGLATAIIGIGFALGQSVFGVIAWFVNGWRYQMLVAYGPQTLTLIYLWILPESVTWLLKKDQPIAAEKTLKKIARLNNKILPTKNIVSSVDRYQKRRSYLAKEFSGLGLKMRIWKILIASFWWITSSLIFFSMTLNANILTDDVYLNFIIICLAEIPGHIIVAPLMTLLGRKTTLILAFVICAGTSFALPFLSTDLNWLYILIYTIAKGSISAALTCLIVLTTDVVPTNRQIYLMAYASTVGRIGGLLAMFSPLIIIAESGVLPFLFGALTAVSAVTVALEKLLQRKLLRGLQF